VDVLPTLLEWLALPASPSAAGRSLLGALRGEPYDGQSRALYARHSAFGRFEEALVHDGTKFLRTRFPPDGLARRLFDLAADPRELYPLPDLAGAERLLDATAAAPELRIFPRVFEETAPDLRRDLDALGYGGEEGGG
jgi:arylsulfatase A-like enzyme